jgi:hypothetical protein
MRKCHKVRRREFRYPLQYMSTTSQPSRMTLSAEELPMLCFWTSPLQHVSIYVHEMGLPVSFSGVS